MYLITYKLSSKPMGNEVEKILKGSLDLIPSPSPSAKIQIMDKRVCLRCKGKTLPYYLKETFPPIKVKVIKSNPDYPF